MRWLDEFKQFALKGNALDIAVGVVIGGAFGKMVTSLVNDILMPPIGKLTGGVNFSDIFLNLDRARTGRLVSMAQAKQAGAAVIAFGQFLNTVIDFFLVAACMFIAVKAFNAIRRLEPAAPTTKDCPYCLSSVPLRATRCPSCTSQLT